MAGGKKDSINELSQKMLAGWVLLADSCPLNCNVPLVESKKQNKVVCVNCDRQFVRDPTKESGWKETETEVIPPDAASETPSNTNTNTNDNSSSSEKKPVVEEVTEVAENETESTTYQNLDYEARRKRNEKASEEIGSKLLAGWTMMDLHCPNPECRTVLMKDNKNHKWCLACNTMVITQAEFNASKHSKVSYPVSKTAPASTNSSPTSSTPIVVPKSKPASSMANSFLSTPTFSAKAMKTIENIDDKNFQLEASHPEKPHMTPYLVTASPLVRASNSAGHAIQQSNVRSNPPPLQLQPHHPPSTPSMPPLYAPPLTFPTQGQIIDNSLQTLYQKMNECNRLLTITNDLEMCKALCSLIRECGSAISALTVLHKTR